MGKVISSTIVTKPEQLNKIDTGPYHILLGPNLRIIKNKKIKASKNKKNILSKFFFEYEKVDLYNQYKK